MDISCYVVGNTALVLECIKILQNKNIKINGVHSSDARIIRWAYGNNLQVYETYDEFSAVIQSCPFDYLFSIVNPIILDNDLLKCPKKLAINFHDSLLPKYAGINATAWALYNNEKIHGITWHVMSSIIDGGNILNQVKIPVDHNETLQSLNIKCFEAAIESFAKLVNDIILGNLQECVQDLHQRTYYTSKMTIPTS